MVRNKRSKLAEGLLSNDDLLLEVLLRVPAKPLTTFKCVSKDWLSLISDPNFRSKHTKISPKSLTLGIYFNDRYNYELKSVSLNQANLKNLPPLTFIKRDSPSFYSGRPKILHACNGLLLGSYHSQLPYFVCNVTTQTMTILPQHVIPSSECYHGNYSAYLIFDPSKSTHFNVVLLGLTFCKHDKKFHYDEEYEERAADCFGLCYEIDVYSSETRVWKRLYFRASHGSPLDFKAVCDGSVHWITKNKVHVQFEVYTSKLAFNPLPSEPTTMDMEKIRYFGECCGHLFLIHIPWCSAKPFHVFELDKDLSSWKIKYNVKMSLVMAAFQDSFQYQGMPDLKWKFFVLCVVKENEINGFSVVLSIPGKIVSYNLRRNTFKVLKEFPRKEFPFINSFCFSDAFPFMPTLCPV